MATSVKVHAAQPVPFLVSSSGLQMQVRKRNGSLEPVDVNKIVRAVERCCAGLHSVDPIRIASKTIGGLFNRATTKELDLLSIQTAASLIAEEPEYSTAHCLRPLSAAQSRTRQVLETPVTASSERIDFHSLVRQGQLAEVVGGVITTGRTSLTVEMELWAEDLLSGKRELCTKGSFVLVAVDEHGRPAPIAPDEPA